MGDDDISFEEESRRLAQLHDQVRRKVQGIFEAVAGDRATRLVETLRADAEVRRAIAASLADDCGPERAGDIAFHLVDWNADAAFLVALLLFPDRFDKDEIAVGLGTFLVHVPNHAAAAAKLYGVPVQDVFGIDALTTGPEDA